MMRFGGCLAAGVSALALASCHPAKLRDAHDHLSWTAPAHMRVIDRLDCPDHQGALDRTDASAAGRS